MSRKRIPPKLNVQPQEPHMNHYFTSSGTFKDGDIILNKDGLRVVSEDIQAAVSRAQDAVFTLEDLETVRVLGKGNSGVVQLTRHKWTGDLFAVKVIQMNIEESVRKQIVRELIINKDSKCPFVVVCFHSFYENGVISLVLEYMDRGSLADVLTNCKAIPEMYLSIICRQVLKGLIYLHHERHVIHRDLKPSNLLLNQAGEVKITDFGVSAVLTNSMGQRNTFVGTYKYMSPERVSGNTHSYDSDVWSLGLVILECALGHFPYLPPLREAGWLNFYELLEAIVGQPAPFAAPDRFSPEFCTFISRCLQKDPRYRSSAVELLRHEFIVMHENRGNDLLANFIESWLPSK